MAKLKDRQSQIPNGYKFELPDLKYRSSPYASFTSIVNSVHNAILSNPMLASRKGWPTEYEKIADWVDRFNAEWCKSNGWREYYLEDNVPLPKDPPKPKEWPAWARAIAIARAAGEVGVGDTAERMIGKENSDAFKKFYNKIFGRSCGCAGRKAAWNAQYPYTLPSDS